MDCPIAAIVSPFNGASAQEAPMFRASLLAVLALAASGGLARAGDLTSNPPTRTSVCLDVSGASLPTVCRVPASRLDKREDICTCPEGDRVEIAVCATGETPPAEGVAYDRARHLAARDGTLLGDMYEGKRMCVAPRNTY
jgi:hypothetical protein